MNKRVVVKVTDSPIIGESPALEDHCQLRVWCHENVKGEWQSYHIHTTDENRVVRGVGLIVFEFGCPKEALKFKLWAGK